MKPEILVNGRFTRQRLTGVQRYATEVVSRLGDRIQLVTPSLGADGARGHVWEQTILPVKVGRKTLWSPTNTGPISVSHHVVTVHDVSVLDHPEWFSRLFASWYSVLIPTLVHRARLVITDSEFSKERIVARTGVSETKLAVVGAGVSAAFGPQPYEVVTSLQKQMGIPSSHYLLSLSSVEPRKNLVRLLKAWGQVVGRLPADVWLVVAGGKGGRSVFQEVLFGQLPPRVFFTGYVPDEALPALYSGALGLVYPALYEGFGLPPLEAMACGTPVLTSSTTSLPEVVGGAACLVDPQDEAAIAWGLEQLVEKTDLRAELARKGLERAAQFSWEKTAAAVWDHLSSIAEDS